MNARMYIHAERKAREGRKAALVAFKRTAQHQGGILISGLANEVTYEFAEENVAVTLTGFEGGLPSAFDAEATMKVKVSEVVTVPWPAVALPNDRLAKAERMLVSLARPTQVALFLCRVVHEALLGHGVQLLLDPAIGFSGRVGERPAALEGGAA